MPYLKINKTKMLETANELDAYVSEHNKKLIQIENEITQMGTFWKGPEYYDVKGTFEKFKSHAYAPGAVVFYIDDFAHKLQNAAKEYESAQLRAIERASKIHKTII